MPKKLPAWSAIFWIDVASFILASWEEGPLRTHELLLWDTLSDFDFISSGL